MKSLLILVLFSFASQAFSGVKISCDSEIEMEYHKVNTLDNQPVKSVWNKIETPSSLNIEIVNDSYVLVNGKKSPIINKIAGVLLLTSNSKELPGVNKDQGTIVMVSLAINVMIPEVTKTTLMSKYFLSSDIQASATSYKCKFVTGNNK